MGHITLGALQAPESLSEDPFKPFDPNAYLREYYSCLGEENRALLAFLSQAYARIFSEIDTASVLEFGGGPTIYQLISAAQYPVSIDFSDYLDENLCEVRAWLRNRPEQFSWDAFILYALAREGKCADRAAREERAQLIRSKVKRLINCDAKKPDPLGEKCRSAYDIVSVHFVPESITTEMVEWDLLMDNIASLVRAQGYLLICAITGATHYRVGERFFPAAPISAELLEAQLERQHFSIILADSIAAEHTEQGYDGICMVLAKKGDS